MTHTLVRVEAPRFWSRWEVHVDGQRIGRVEKRGLAEIWYAIGESHWSVEGSQRDAVRALVKPLERSA